MIRLKEKDIIYKCQQGEQAAQRMLFDQYYNYVYTICHRYVLHHHDTQDVVSITFNKIFKGIDKLKNLENHGLRRWIQTISINESLRFLNKKQPIDYTTDHFFLDQKVEPITESTEVSQASEIKKIINEMPKGYRTIFLMNIVEGLSHAEIAEHLNISRNTSKSQMLKARRYLQIKLRKEKSKEYGR